MARPPQVLGPNFDRVQADLINTGFMSLARLAPRSSLIRIDDKQAKSKLVCHDKMSLRKGPERAELKALQESKRSIIRNIIEVLCGTMSSMLVYKHKHAYIIG